MLLCRVPSYADLMSVEKEKGKDNLLCLLYRIGFLYGLHVIMDICIDT